LTPFNLPNPILNLELEDGVEGIGKSDLYSGGSSSAGTALVESGNCKVSFILNRGIVTEVTPWSRDALRTGLQAYARSGSGNETMVNCVVVSVSSRDNNE